MRSGFRKNPRLQDSAFRLLLSFFLSLLVCKLVAAVSDLKFLCRTCIPYPFCVSCRVDTGIAGILPRPVNVAPDTEAALPHDEQELRGASHGIPQTEKNLDNKQSHSATEEKSSSSVSSCGSNSSVLKVATVANTVDSEHVHDCLDGLNNQGGSGTLPSVYHYMNKSRPNASRGAIKDSARSTNHKVSTHGSVADPIPLVVKGAYKEETFRLEFSYTPSVDELKKEVGEKLELEFGKYRMKFKDEDDDWVLMRDDSDLKHCLRLSRSSVSDIVKLKLLISDIVSN